MTAFLEHEDEAAPGIPAELPASERILWQGKPDWKVLARTKFHVRKLAAYFAALLLMHQVVEVRGGASFGESLSAGAIYLLLAAVGLGVVLLLAWATARATVFTLTNRRAIIRCGVSLPLSMNLPFTKIDNADLRDLGGGYGDIALTPAIDSRASYILLWPYVRPWRISRVRPMLRAIPGAEHVAAKLAAALEADMLERAARPQVPEPPPVETPGGQEPDGRRWHAYPTVPLAAAVSLVVVSLVATAWVSFIADEPEQEPAAEIVASVDLRFEDADDGSIRVMDAGRDTLIDRVEPGSGGFMRSALRLLAIERLDAGGSAEAAFSLQRTAGGRLLLVDTQTDRVVDLWAFGADNARLFLRYLPGAEADSATTGTEPAADAGEPDLATVALTNKEGR